MNTKTAIQILRAEFYNHKYGYIKLMQAAEIAIPFLKTKGWQMDYGSTGIYTLWVVRHYRQDVEAYDPLCRPFWFRRRLVELDSGKYARPDEGLPF